MEEKERTAAWLLSAKKCRDGSAPGTILLPMSRLDIGITFPSLPCLPSFLHPTLFSQRTSIYPNEGHFRDAELLSSHEYCQLKSAHTDNAGCEAEPCRPASIQTPSAIIRVISMSSERAFISQEFRQSHNASFLHEGYVTNSNGMRFFFCCFYKLLI